MKSETAKKLASDVLYIAIVIGIALGAWAIGAAAADSEFVLPDIATTFRALGDVFVLPAFWKGLLQTLLRVVISYALSALIAFLLFFFSFCYYGAERVIGPIISALRTLPTMAVSLILAIWAGAKAAPIILGALVIMPVLYSAMRGRTATLPTELIEIARLCGAGRARTFFAVALPSAAGGMPESLSSAFSFCIKIILAAEILMQTAGSLGMLMYISQAYYKTATLIALVFSAVIISVIAEYAIKFAMRRGLKRYCD